MKIPVRVQSLQEMSFVFLSPKSLYKLRISSSHLLSPIFSLKCFLIIKEKIQVKYIRSILTLTNINIMFSNWWVSFLSQIILYLFDNISYSYSKCH